MTNTFAFYLLLKAVTQNDSLKINYLRVND